MGGAAGSRTPVQTGNQYGFYMLILLLIVGKKLAEGSRPFPYSPEISRWPRERASHYPYLDGTPYTTPGKEVDAAEYPVSCHLGQVIKL